MKNILYVLLTMAIFSGPLYAEVLVMSPNGVTVSKDSISAANTAVDAAGKTILVTTPQRIFGDITLADDRTWKIQKGGSITATGRLTINGLFEAGPYQVFTGSGTVTLRNTDTIRPEWFGNTDGSADNVQIQRAIESIPKGKSAVVKFLAKTYAIHNKIKVPSGVLLEGVWSAYNSSGTVFISNVAADNCVEIGNGRNNVSDAGIKNIAIAAGSAKDGVGLGLYYTYNCSITKVKVTGFTAGTGIRVSGSLTENNASIQNNFETIYLANNYTNLHLTGRNNDNNSSADESIYKDIRINLSTLTNAKGIHIEKGVGNFFSRVSIIDSAKTTGTVALYFDDGKRSVAYSASENLFIGTWFENVTTAVHFAGNTSNNIIFNFHDHNATIKVNDLSGGANIIRYPMGGITAAPQNMTYTGQTYQNLLQNSEMEKWENGDTLAPTSWSLLGTGARVMKDSTNHRKGSYAAAITRSGSDVDFYQSVTDYAFLRGRMVSASVWVKSSTAKSVQLLIRDSAGDTYSAYHSGSGQYELLSVRRKISTLTNHLQLIIRLSKTNNTSYIDGATLLEGIEVTYPTDKPMLDSQFLTREIKWDPGLLVNGKSETKLINVNGTSFGNYVIVSAPYDVQNMTITGYVQATDKIAIRIKNDSGRNVDLPAGLWKVLIIRP